MQHQPRGNGHIAASWQTRIPRHACATIFRRLSADVQLLELTPEIAAKTNELPEDFQGDPFDRAIVATAAISNLTLITTDSAIRDAKACSVEYYPFKPSRARR